MESREYPTKDCVNQYQYKTKEDDIWINKDAVGRCKRIEPSNLQILLGNAWAAFALCSSSIAAELLKQLCMSAFRVALKVENLNVVRSTNALFEGVRRIMTGFLQSVFPSKITIYAWWWWWYMGYIAY